MTDAADHSGLRIGIYADDLTGALDAAAPFAAAGMSVYVSVFGVVPDNMAADYRVMSLNIDTRHGDRFPVFDKAARAAKELRTAGFTLLVNKIDSTLRGHAGMEARAGLSPDTADPREIEAKGTWSGPRLALIAPSFPAMGRVVTDGQVRINGELLAESEVGRDPLSPVTTSDIVELVELNTGIKPVAVRLDEIRDDDRFNGLISGMSINPPVIAVCDADTDDDLTLIASAGVDFAGDIILSGSAGITGALARYLSDHDSGAVGVDNPVTANSGPCLIVSGSQRTVTGRQLELASIGRDLEWLQLDPSGLLEEDAAGEIRDGAVARLVGALEAGRHAAVSLLQDDRPDTIEGDIRTRLVRELGAICYRVARRTIPGSLVLIGGDTSQAALRAVGAAGIVLRGEPFPGVPAGTIDGGLLSDVPVVTKAGAFGQDEVVVDVIDYLARK